MPGKSRNRSDASLAYSLGEDAAAVMAMRCAKIASGDLAGMAEAQLMVTEKIAALAHTQWALLSGAYGYTPVSMARGVLRHYAHGVRANRLRLSGSRSGRGKR